MTIKLKNKLLTILSVICVSFSGWILWNDNESKKSEQNDLVNLIMEVLPYLLITIGIIAGLLFLYQGIKKIT